MKRRLNIDQIGKKAYEQNGLVFDDAPRIYNNVVYNQANRVKVIGPIEDRLQKTLWRGKLDRSYESVNYNGRNDEVEDV